MRIGWCRSQGAERGLAANCNGNLYRDSDGPVGYQADRLGGNADCQGGGQKPGREEPEAVLHHLRIIDPAAIRAG